jgi:hypothetical protein
VSGENMWRLSARARDSVVLTHFAAT